MSLTTELGLREPAEENRVNCKLVCVCKRERERERERREREISVCVISDSLAFALLSLCTVR